ncbi:hypothetical protein B0H16DRAFT_1819518 [Mycena metata]|uniref:Uncharacterized protein n=1 Tax=Mycena metata TaxID=1033252 RepID=A0AAD7J868_9AGAR|nr:hypothetical protein B0H16DRAFT_1819518 [Mycena metata]
MSTSACPHFAVPHPLMLALPNGSLPIIASLFSSATKVVLVGIIGRPLVGTSYYASPAHLTRVLSDAMSNLEKVYADMVCPGLSRLLTAEEVEHLNSSLRILQLKADHRTENLRNLQSWRATICDFIAARSVTLFRCIKKVRDLETRIKCILRTGQVSSQCCLIVAAFAALSRPSIFGDKTNSTSNIPALHRGSCDGFKIWSKFTRLGTSNTGSRQWIAS